MKKDKFHYKSDILNNFLIDWKKPETIKTEESGKEHCFKDLAQVAKVEDPSAINVGDDQKVE